MPYFDHLRIRYRCEQTSNLQLQKLLDCFGEIFSSANQTALTMNVQPEADEMLAKVRKCLFKMSKVVPYLEAQKGIVTQIAYKHAKPNNNNNNN